MDRRETFLLPPAKAGFRLLIKVNTHTPPPRLGVMDSSDLNVHMAPYPQATSERAHCCAQWYTYILACMHSYAKWQTWAFPSVCACMYILCIYVYMYVHMYLCIHACNEYLFICTKGFDTWGRCIYSSDYTLQGLSVTVCSFRRFLLVACCLRCGLVATFL